MKQNLLKAMAFGGAMLLSASALSAAVPEHLYMVGEASPSLWHIDLAIEMTNEGEGVFSYHGNLYNQNLQFIDARDWETGVRYVPEVSGSWKTAGGLQSLRPTTSKSISVKTEAQ